MRITALVENTSHCELKGVHGLSLYVETAGHRLLFDLGSDRTLLENAAKRGIDLAPGSMSSGGPLNGTFPNLWARSRSPLAWTGS